MRRKMRKQTLKRIIAIAVTVVILVPSYCIDAYAIEGSDKPQVMVSLGDSFSSGEGIEPFYGQDDDISIKVANPDWLAHRSQGSWPGMLMLPNTEGTMADNRGENWYFEAASGAVTDHFRNAFTKEYKRGKEYAGSYNLEPQLAIFDKLGENAVDYVTLTIGGNDVGFVDIITSCALGSTVLNIGGLADKLNYTWDEFYANGGTKDRLKDAYESVAESAGSQAQIIVAGYPTLLDKNGKGAFISKAEAAIVNANISKFNYAIKDIVDTCQKSGMNISFVSVESAFNGHEAYSDDPYINGIIIRPKSEDLVKKMPSAYSIHPNANGAKAYASCVQAKIDEIEEAKRTQMADEEKDLSKNPEATDDEKDAKPLHFSGVVLQPEDVVLKMFDALQDGDYEKAAECLDPATEQQFDFWGGIASTVVGLFTGKYVSWGQLLLEAAGATDVDVIECYSDNLVIESNFDLINAFLPKIPGVKNVFCTEADVYVKYRYKYNNEYYTEEDVFHVRRYEWSGWRIEKEH